MIPRINKWICHILVIYFQHDFFNWVVFFSDLLLVFWIPHVGLVKMISHSLWGNLAPASYSLFIFFIFNTCQ